MCEGFEFLLSLLTNVVFLQQIATEHGLEVSEKLDGISVPQQQVASPAKEQDDLAQRLEKLKAK